MQEVEAMCNRAIIINHGKIVTDNSTDQLKAMELAGNRYTVEFDSTVDIDKLRHIEGVDSARHLSGNSYSLHAKKDNDIREALFHWAVSHNHTVLTIQKEQDSLEHIFQELTKK